MLKTLALTLLVAIFIASGFTLAPATDGPGDAAPALEISDAATHVSAMSESTRSAKRGREVVPIG